MIQLKVMLLVMLMKTPTSQIHATVERKIKLTVPSKVTVWFAAWFV